MSRTVKTGRNRRKYAGIINIYDTNWHNGEQSAQRFSPKKQEEREQSAQRFPIREQEERGALFASGSQRIREKGSTLRLVTGLITGRKDSTLRLVTVLKPRVRGEHYAQRGCTTLGTQVGLCAEGCTHLRDTGRHVPGYTTVYREACTRVYQSGRGIPGYTMVVGVYLAIPWW